VHVIDSGLAGWLLGLSAAKISSRDPAVLTEFGHLVETFAVGEILKQVSWSEEVATAAYFRTQDGNEVEYESGESRSTGYPDASVASCARMLQEARSLRTYLPFEVP
jgi:predicted AAA+ superfamily ATPase